SNRRAFGPKLTVGNSSFLVDAEDAFTTDAKNNALVFSNAPIVDVATIDQTGQGCAPLPANSLQGAIALMKLDGWDPSTDDCNANHKFNNAEAAGAVAAIVADSIPEDLRNIEDFPFFFSYDWLGSTNLPGGFVPYTDGVALRALAANPTAAATLDFRFNQVP